MKLRRRPKTVLKLPPPPTSSQQQQAASLKAAASVVGSNGQHSQQSGGVARRSQRSAAAAAATLLSPDSGGVTAAASSATDPLWSAATAEPVDVGALEDRTLLRSLESYGPDYEYLAASTLPVHGDDTSTAAPKTAAQVQQRLVRLLQKQQRQRKRSTAFKAWLAPKVAPPTVEVPDSTTTAASRKKGAATPKRKARRKR